MNILAAYFYIGGKGDPMDVPFLPWLFAGVGIFMFSIWLAVEISNYLHKRK